MNKTLKIGHRGAAGLEPENTMISFQRAVDFGADAIELDIQTSQDGHSIVMHDGSVDRTTDGHGRVADMTLEKIKRLRTKEKAQSISTLEEVLGAYADSIKVFVELKSRSAADSVAQTLKRINVKKNVIVISFLPWTLVHFKELAPEYPIGFSMMLPGFFPAFLSQSILMSRVKSLGVEWVNLYHPLVNQKLVTYLHSQGIKVNAWTVDKEADIKKIRSLNVDGIITNFPDRL